MESKNRRSAENSERSGVCDDVKVKFPLYVFPETMQKIDMLYEADNCKSKTEFIEKAIRFYCGYLLNKDSVAAEYAAPQITAITEGIVKGTEQRLSRALFKVAVELGAVSHMLAAINDIDDETMVKLRAMCTDEVRKINGVINFERAVRYQRAETLRKNLCKFKNCDKSDILERLKNNRSNFFTVYNGYCNLSRFFGYQPAGMERSGMESG